ncbi:MAG: hypothetical protein AAF529_00245 [Pseudomonadota bacterium]
MGTNRNIRLWRFGRAGALALALMMALLASLMFGKSVNAPEVLTVRKVAVGLPPPPPPPPAQTDPITQTNSPQLDLLSDLEQGTPLLQAKVAPPEMQPTRMPQPELRADMPNLDSAMTFDWQGFGLNELDRTPRLLTDLKIRFPQSLKSKGVRRAAVELNVLIDETGKVFLKEILKNPYPQLTTRIEAVMRRARFTPPQKDGAKVRAVFIWPIEFRSDA